MAPVCFCLFPAKYIQYPDLSGCSSFVQSLESIIYLGHVAVTLKSYREVTWISTKFLSSVRTAGATVFGADMF